MLTPQEVSEKVFPKASFGSGGYSMASVDEFLDALTEDYTALFKENVTLKAKLKVLAEKVEEYRSTEEAMRQALLTAQKMAAKLVQDAQVDEFLDTLTEDYTALYKENVTLKAKLKILAEKVEEYRATEDAMRSTLLTAQKMAAKLVQEAQTEKENLLKEAKEQHAAQLAQLEQDKQDAEEKLVMAKQSLAEFVRHGSELCAQQQEFLNSLPEMELPHQETAPAGEVKEIQQDIMQHLDDVLHTEPETASEQPAPQEMPISDDFRLSLDELKFGRNYTGE